MFSGKNIKDFPLWCYLYYWKFEDLIQRSALFFAFRKTFTDACEGEDTKYRQLERKLLSQRQIQTTAHLANIMNCCQDGTFISMSPIHIQSTEQVRFNNTLDNTGINCWTMYENYNEDIASTFCWNSRDFVAIETTFTNLLSAFPVAIKEANSLFFNRVKYYDDYDNAQIPIDKTTDWLFHMSAKYKREKEFRFVFLLDETRNEGQYIFDQTRELSKEDLILKCLRANILIKENQKIGFHIPINLNATKMVVHCSSQRTFNKAKELMSKYRVYTQNVSVKLI